MSKSFPHEPLPFGLLDTLVLPMTETHAWPRKVRKLRNPHFDSTVWNDFPFRDDDIVISSC